MAVTDVTISERPNQIGAFPALVNAYVVAVEEFSLDRTIDEQGRPLKDVSHEGSRWLNRNEVSRILDVPGSVLGTIPPDAKEPDVPGLTARMVYPGWTREVDGTAGTVRLMPCQRLIFTG